MTQRARDRSFHRRAFIGFLALVPAAAAIGGTRARPSVREVVTILKEADHGRPADLSRLDLSDLNLADLDFKGADLSEANLFGADLTACNLERANLTRTVLDRSVLVRTNFTGANLSNATIRRPSVTSDMSFNSHEMPVFRNANLANVQLTSRLDGADFTGADLTSASFSLWHERDLGGAPTTGLDRCDFTSAQMRGVNMRGLSLARAVFRNADLRDADLRDTDLRGSDLTGARLEGARLEGARLDGATGLSAPVKAN